MLCQRLLKSAVKLGTATKFTFANGKGISPRELQIMKKEALGKYNPNLPDLPEQRYIPVEFKGHQNFFYDTEIFAFVNRVGTDAANIPDVTQLLNIALSHETYDDKAMVLAAKAINSKGCEEVSDYLYAHHEKLFPNLPHSILDKISHPLKSLSFPAYDKMCRTLCLHELVRIELDDDDKRKINHEAYWSAIGGIYMSLKHGQGVVAAKHFIDTFILNVYAFLDLRTLIKYDPKPYLTQMMEDKNMYPPVERITNEVGVGTELPTYVVGIFSGDDILAQAADYKLEEAIEEAWMSSIRFFLMEQDFNAAPVYITLPEEGEEQWIEELIQSSRVPDKKEPEGIKDGWFS